MSFSSKSQVVIKAMKWTDQHDLELIKDILTERPYDHPKGSRQIGLVWERIVDSLNSRADIVFNLKDIRAVRDRYNLLARKYKKRERERKLMLRALALMSQVSLMTLLRKLLLFLRVKKRKEKRKKLLKMRTEIKQKMPDLSHLKLLEKQQKEKHHQETIRSEPRKQLL